MVFLFLWQPGVFSSLANSPRANPRKQVLARAFSFASSSPQRGIWPQVCRVLLARDAGPGSVQLTGRVLSAFRLKVEITLSGLHFSSVRQTYRKAQRALTCLSSTQFCGGVVF